MVIYFTLFYFTNYRNNAPCLNFPKPPLFFFSLNSTYSFLSKIYKDLSFFLRRSMRLFKVRLSINIRTGFV